MDTHTAVAAAVYKKYKEETKDDTKTVIVSTASPYKFARAVMTSINAQYDKKTDFELLDELQVVSKVKQPRAIEDIKNAPIVHDTVCEVNEMETVVKNFLKK